MRDGGGGRHAELVGKQGEGEGEGQQGEGDRRTGGQAEAAERVVVGRGREGGREKEEKE